jgi:predicted RNase H-like nuclease
VLRGVCVETDEILTTALERHPRLLELYMARRIQRDDILDALCLAVHARTGLARGFETLPVRPERDSRALPMENVYAKNIPRAID